MSSFKTVLYSAAVVGGLMVLAKVMGYDLKRIVGPGGFSAEYYPPSPPGNNGEDAAYHEIEEARRRVDLAEARRAREQALEEARIQREAREEAERRSQEDRAARLEAERKSESLRENQEGRLSPAPQAREPQGPGVVELPTIVVPAEGPPAPDEWDAIVRKRPPEGSPPWIGSSKGYRSGYPYLTWRKTIRPGRRDEYGTPGAPDTARDDLPPSCLNNPLGQPVDMCPQQSGFRQGRPQAPAVFLFCP